MQTSQTYSKLMNIAKDLRKLSEAKSEKLLDDWRQKKFGTNEEERIAYNNVLCFDSSHGDVTVRYHHMALNSEKTRYNTVMLTMDDEEHLIVFGNGLFRPRNFRFELEERKIPADAKVEDVYDTLVQIFEMHYVDLTEEFARFEGRVEHASKKRKLAK